MLSLNTNVAALYAQRALNQSTAKIASLNKTILGAMGDGTMSVAADGTSGSATPTFLTAQIKGIAQALTNTTNSTSLMTQANTAITKVSTDLTTMQTQAAAYAAGNASAKATALAAYNVAQADLTTVVSGAVYNGRNLVNGASTLSFNVGPNPSQAAGRDIISVSLPDLSIYGTSTTTPIAITSSASDFTDAVAAVSTASGNATGVVSRLGYVSSELQSNYNTSTAQRTSILNNANTSANTELAVQTMLQNAAQAILAQANTSAQAVLALIKSAQVATA